ncbi:MAG: ABC transporter ATP-binding protein [Gemmatimonadales bacterium]|nr:ABC transporter ATP-binding protein [Gemmatimonadales bacterium]MDZ4390739.1 ABC transporter ATP-binding protein [Gemmatimonadales bacterium]
MFGLLRPHRGLFLLGMLAAFVGAVLEGTQVVLLEPLLRHLFPATAADAAPGTRLEGWLRNWLDPWLAGLPAAEVTLRLVALFLGVLLLKNVATWLAGYLAVVVQEGMVRRLRTRLYAHLLRLDLDHFQHTRGGQLTAVMISDADQVRQVVVAAFAAFFQNAVVILVTIGVMAAISPRLTLLVLVLAPLLVFGVQGLLRRLARHARVFAHERGELTATIVERLGAMRMIRAAGGESAEEAEFGAQTDRYRKGMLHTQRYALLTSPVSELFGGAMLMLIFWAAANPAISGVRMEVPATLIFVLAALRVMSPIKAITNAPALLATAAASGERIFEVLDLPATEVDPPDAIPARFERDLVFDQVTFGYRPGEAVVRDVSFRVGRGEVVALVGPSGAGKTTLLELIPRFHDPVAGEIRLDGVPLTRLKRASLRSLIAVVGQDTILLHDTVRRNIAYARPEATAAEVEAAARAANAHDFICRLPDRYETVLGERGTRLSGGERQRIAIARALLRDAPILILDEATNALDPAAERLVQEAIERVMADRTVLVIAHRLATVRDADRIIVIEEGRVEEQGTHADLHAAGGLYRRLHDLQFSAAEVTS